MPVLRLDTTVQNGLRTGPSSERARGIRVLTISTDKVNNHFDPQHGYKGPTPNRGEKADPSKHPDKVTKFKGNETRDGHGHPVDAKP